MKTRSTLLVMIACAATACESGDDTSVRAFHGTVRTGSSLSDVVLAAERAQKPEVGLGIAGKQCPGDAIEIGRNYGNAYVRVTHAQPTPEPSGLPGHTEMGFPTREAFAAAVTKQLPSFYGCREFVFTFGRDQVWPTTDSFSVTVDTGGKITSVSEVRRDELG